MLRTLARILGLGRRSVGARGEDLAADHVQSQGWRILDRNVRVPMGEADIVAETPDGEIVLIEVKTRVRRAGVAQPKPEAQLGPRKAAKLRAILAYLTRANGWQSRRKRIDLIAIELTPADLKQQPELRHHRRAVDANG